MAHAPLEPEGVETVQMLRARPGALERASPGAGRARAAPRGPHGSGLPGDPRLREVVCIPVSMLAPFLGTIYPNKCRVDMQDKVRVYQSHCASSFETGPSYCLCFDQRRALHFHRERNL